MQRHLKTKTLLSLCCTVLGFMLFTAEAEARIKYGLWEISVQVQFEGTPVDTPEETFQKCISKDDLTPGDKKDNEGCDNDKVTVKGDTVNWTVSCSKDKHTMTGSGQVVYNKDTMTGTAQFQAGGKGMATMKMKLHYKGKYVGNCK